MNTARLRATLTLTASTTLGFAAFAAESRAQPRRPDPGSIATPAPQRGAPRPISKTATIGPRYDVGTGHAIGVGYLDLIGFPPSEPFFWGVGGDLGLFVGDVDRVAGGSGVAVLHATVGHSPPITFELAAGGLLSNDQVGGVGHAGAFVSFLVGELGYSYQVPLGPFTRPSWLSSHQFSLRVHIPLGTR